MKRKALLVAMLASLSATALVGCAGMDKLMGGGLPGMDAVSAVAGGAVMSAADLGNLQATMLGDTQAVAVNVAGAQKKLHEALGYKEKAAELNDYIKSAKSGNVDGDYLKKLTTVSAQADEALLKELAEVKVLSAKQKVMVGASLVDYAKGVYGTAKLAVNAAKAGKEAANMIKRDWTKALQLKNQFAYVLDAAVNLPPFATQLIETGVGYIDLAKKLGVDTSAASKIFEDVKNEFKL